MITRVSCEPQQPQSERSSFCEMELHVTVGGLTLLTTAWPHDLPAFPFKLLRLQAALPRLRVLLGGQRPPKQSLVVFLTEHPRTPTTGQGT